MISKAHKAKGPATAPTVPDHGSNNPCRDMKMNEHEDNTAPDTGAMPFSRRTALKLGAVLALMAHTPVGMASDRALGALPISTDEFLSRATAGEKVRYHATALAEAMHELNPSMDFIAAFDTHKEFVLVRGYRREGRA